MKIKRPYVPDIKMLGQICEGNYVRLNKLLPEFAQDSEFKFWIEHDPSHKSYVRLKVTESFPYTSTILVSQEGLVSDWIRPPEMQVRLYHDARMAEVISYQKQHRIRGQYHYPNPEMRMPDEKIQLNSFLAEWLAHGLKHGRSNYQFDYLESDL